MATFQAGASVVTITPPLGTPLAGLFEYREAVTIADDLTARALVLDDGSIRIALVVCDLIRVAASTVAAARERITARCGIPGDRVMIAATHTHTGPVTFSGQGDTGEPPSIPAGQTPTYPLIAPADGGLLSTPADPAYLDWVADRIADGVAVACARLHPAWVASGAAGVDGVCFNRRFHMRDGTVVFNPGIRNPDIVKSAGPVDHDVTALLVEDNTGTPLALWANLALHYVGTDDPLAISADYFGQFARVIERVLGEGCVGSLANGASGDINNVDVSQAATVGATEQARRVATAVAAAAIQATVVAQRQDAPVLDAERVPLAVNRWPITNDDVALANRIVAHPTDQGEPPAADFSFVVGQPIPAYQRRTYAHEVLALARTPRENVTEVQVLRIGDLAIVALPGEIFVELGLAIKAGSPFPRTAVVGLANDHIGYVPTATALRQGSYETWRSRTSWSAPGTGEAMVATALDRLRILRDRSEAGRS